MAELSKRDRDKLARQGAAFDRLDRTLRDLGRQGLQRLSRPVLDQLLGAEQVAHHAGLVKLERELTTLATHARRYLDRDPLFAAPVWLAALNRAWELNERAKAAWSEDGSPDDLVPIIGQARRSYEWVDRPLAVQAIGAQGWVTASDFVGITVWLHEAETGQLFQASAARPVAYFGSDPRRLLYGEISDHHRLTLLDLAHGAWVFHGAKASADGRLSLHRELEIEPGPWSGAAAYRGMVADDWLGVVDRLRDEAVDGQERRLVYVEPRDVSRILVDEKRSVARCRMTDDNGATMVVHVPVDTHTNPLIDSLGRLTSDPTVRPDGWFGRVAVGDGELRFTPATVLYREPVVLELRGRREVHAFHPGLEPARTLSRT